MSYRKSIVVGFFLIVIPRLDRGMTNRTVMLTTSIQKSNYFYTKLLILTGYLNDLSFIKFKNWLTESTISSFLI
ncbi:MAG: hypothetical protein O7D30_04440 [Rickettsia endosymbiont of Ixodes persulcatus]|nr:hypothetical protein [Rickettsia endosymbiont of Ixodes persulcatus]